MGVLNRVLLAALPVLVGVTGLEARQSPADVEQRVAEVFSQYHRSDSPGCAVGVTRDGWPIFARGYGMANLEHGVPIGPASVFHVASVSKQFAAFAIVLLAQEGRLRLDDDIRLHLPEMHDFGEPITIRHLVHHTSGIRDQWNLFSLGGWRGGDIKTQQDVLDLAFAQRELNFPPGSEYMYSNTGYTLMAEIVRRVSGKNLREYSHEAIFEPLGMHNTHFHDNYNMIVRNRTHGYAPTRDGFRISNPAYSLMGATSLFTTVEDMARWEWNFNTMAVGGEEAFAQMEERGRLNNGRDLSYAFALSHGQQGGQRTLGHGGADAGYRTQFLRFPDQRVSVTVLCNLSSASPARLAREVAAIFLEDVLEDPPERPAAASREQPRREAPEPHRPDLTELQGFVGRYYSEELNLDYVVELRRDRLVVTRRRMSDAALTPREPDVFRMGGTTVRFQRNDADEVTEMLLTTGRVRNLRFVRRD